MIVIKDSKPQNQMFDWNPRIVFYAKILTLTFLHDSLVLFWNPLFDNIVTFVLSFDYTDWTIVDARVKKDEHLEIQTIHLDPK